MNLLWHMPTLQSSCCGISRRAMRLADELIQYGHRVCFVVRADKTDLTTESIGSARLRRMALQPGKCLHWSLQSRRRVCDARRLISTMALPHDVFLSCQPEAVLAYARRKSRRPLVFVCGGSVLLHEAAERAEQSHLSLLRRAPYALDRLLRRRVEREAACVADAVVFNSETTSQRLRAAYSLDAGKCFAVIGGVDPENYKPTDSHTRSTIRRALSIADSTRVVTWTGRLSPEKNLGLLLESLRHVKHRDVLVQIVGDGPCHAHWSRTAQKLGVAERVRFCGRQDDVRPFLLASDLFVFPSRGESFGGALVEAMACGLACIALRADGRSIRNACQEILSHGETGWLAEAMPELLADAVDHLLVNPALCHTISAAARKEAVARFTWTGAGRSLDAVLRRFSKHAMDHTSLPDPWLPTAAIGG